MYQIMLCTCLSWELRFLKSLSLLISCQSWSEGKLAKDLKGRSKATNILYSWKVVMVKYDIKQEAEMSCRSQLDHALWAILSFHLLALPTNSNPRPTIRHFTLDPQSLQLQRSNSFPQTSPQVPSSSSHFNGWKYVASQIPL